MNAATRAGGSVNERPVLAWVLVPFAETTDSTLDYYNDYGQSRAEFERAFGELGLEPHEAAFVGAPMTVVTSSVALRAGGARERGCKAGLAGAGVGDEGHVLAFVDVFAAYEFGDQHLVH